jgi:hypothetical protein
MTHHWDEFSKSLGEPLPRRESLRRLGVVLTGAVLSPLGLDTALAGKPDPCKSFCRCRNKRQQDQCLNACKACNKDTRRVCGGCGSYVCCGSGRTCCGGYCTDLDDDVLNCGACGFVCDPPGPYESGACIDGDCTYTCADGAVHCDGLCTFVRWDASNCGACGTVCPGSAPWCNDGVCICPSGMAVCDGQCVDILRDPDNCGACGAGCPSSAPYCEAGICSDQQCAPGLTRCFYGCVNLSSDPYNCGACGHQCGQADSCSGGVCVGVCYGCY